MNKWIIYAAKHSYLVIGLVLVVLALNLKSIPSVAVFQIAMATVLFYLVSAFVHHHHDKTLTFEVIVEYILLGGLVLIILANFLI